MSLNSVQPWTVLNQSRLKPFLFERAFPNRGFKLGFLCKRTEKSIETSCDAKCVSNNPFTIIDNNFLYLLASKVKTSEKEDKDAVKQENGEAAGVTADKSEDSKDTVDEDKQDQTDGS